MQVKIVLRERSSGRYYRSPKRWVANAYDALTFANIIEAEEFCRSHSLEHLQLIQQIGYPGKAARERSRAHAGTDRRLVGRHSNAGVN